MIIMHNGKIRPQNTWKICRFDSSDWIVDALVPQTIKRMLISKGPWKNLIMKILHLAWCENSVHWVEREFAWTSLAEPNAEMGRQGSPRNKNQAQGSFWLNYMRIIINRLHFQVPFPRLVPRYHLTLIHKHSFKRCTGCRKRKKNIYELVQSDK